MNAISKNLGISISINSCGFYDEIISKAIIQSTSKSNPIKLLSIHYEMNHFKTFTHTHTLLK